MKKSVEESDWVQPKNDAGEGTAQNFANAFIFVASIYCGNFISFPYRFFIVQRRISFSSRATKAAAPFIKSRYIL